MSESLAPGSIRIACASNQGEELDGHFGSCPRFLIFQVSPGESRLIEIREVAPDIGGDSDRNAVRADLIADCRILYVVSIGGPAAAKVIRRNIHPVKVKPAGDAREIARALAASLAVKPPPWLAKAMGRAPEERFRHLSSEG